jgi:hypothetical protein
MYARLHDEINLWRQSKKINLELIESINNNAANAYYDKTLPDFIKEITDTYGLERSIFFISRVVVAADWDKRYSSDVRARAEQVDLQDMKEGEKLYEAGKDPMRTADPTNYLYSNVHPCILNDVFRLLMKMEQEQISLPSADAENENERDKGAEQ